MSAHVLSPRPIDFLPPTLQPHAIASSAPGTDRRLSFLVACLVYTSVAAVLALAARNPGMLQMGNLRTQPVLLRESDDVPSEPQIIPIPEPPRTIVPPTVRNTTTDAPPILPTNVVPETPGELPDVDVSRLGPRSTDETNPNLVGTNPPWNGGTNTDRVVTGAPRPVVIDLEPSAVKVMYQVQPNYPPLARYARIQGAVVLRMTIDAQGVPTDVRVISSPHTALEGESLRVAHLWRFQPARLDGRPIAAKFNLTLNYRLTQ